MASSGGSPPQPTVPKGYRRCDLCAKVQSISNWRRHMDKYHSDIARPDPKHPSLFCTEHQQRFAKPAKSRHIRKEHGGHRPAQGVIVPYNQDTHQALPLTKPNHRPTKTTSKSTRATPRSSPNTHPRLDQNTSIRNPKHRPTETTSKPTRATPKSPPTIHPTFDQNTYVREAKKAQRRALIHLVGLQNLIPESRRLEQELDVYTGLMDVAVPPQVHLFDPSSVEKMKLGAPETKNLGYCLLVGSDFEAEIATRHGTLAYPFLVPFEKYQKSSDRLEKESYLRYLETKHNVHIHAYADVHQPSGTGTTPPFLVPVALSGSDAVSLFRSTTTNGMPTNILNLDGYKANPQPWFLASQDNFQVMRTVKEDNHAGKPDRAAEADLSNSSTFQLCASKGAWSMPHIDRHGVTTSVFCDSGEKIWLVWPHMMRSCLKSWAGSQDYCPPLRPMVVYLRPGDLLIMPPSTVHAPYSLTDVIMTGTMHWDSRYMVHVPAISLLETDYPTVTNEDPSLECVKKLRVIEKCWRDKQGPWEFGTTDNLNLFSRRLDVSIPPSRHCHLLLIPLQALEKRMVRCSCVNTCKGKRCPCHKLDVLCTPACHRGRPSTRCQN